MYLSFPPLLKIHKNHSHKSDCAKTVHALGTNYSIYMIYKHTICDIGVIVHCIINCKQSGRIEPERYQLFNLLFKVTE